jgi:sec-independent protein translocase protein TatC
VAFYAGLLLALPLQLYQIYAFVIPAFTPRERSIAVPLMVMVPVLFLSGVAFGYFVVLARAIAFLQNFNDDNFDILVQASTYYKFCIVFLGAIGLLFQIPVGILAITRTGIVTPRQLRKGRGYAILAIAVVAAVATPTPDPVTMTLAMGPLIVLYELSILLAAWLDRVRPVARDDDEPEELGDLDDGFAAGDDLEPHHDRSGD